VRGEVYKPCGGAAGRGGLGVVRHGWMGDAVRGFADASMVVPG